MTTPDQINTRMTTAHHSSSVFSCFFYIFFSKCLHFILQSSPRQITWTIWRSYQGAWSSRGLEFFRKSPRLVHRRVDLTGTLADDHPEPRRILEVALFFFGKKTRCFVDLFKFKSCWDSWNPRILEQILRSVPMFQANIRGNLGEGNDIGWCQWYEGDVWKD